MFLKIDEHAFSVLYSQNNGRPNFPVNILVSLEILKEMLNVTDEQLFERFSFDVAFRRAKGIEDFSEYAMAEKTLYNFRAALWEYKHEHGENHAKPLRCRRDVPHKNGEGHQGYAVHAVEPCDEGNPLQVVMDVELTANNVDDAAVLAPGIKVCD